MTIESDNMREEIREVVSKCIRCGICKSHCPVLRVIREEQISPRGLAILLDNNYYEKIIYECNLCKACEKKCPLNLKLCDAFQKARIIVASQKKDFNSHKEMLKNLDSTGNIYGIVEKKD